MTWRKAKASGENGGQCVELAEAGEHILVRDSKLGDASPVLRLSRAQVAGLVADVKAGNLDDLA